MRLGNKNLTSNVESIKKQFKINPYGSYNLLYHSSKIKRGVGILFKCNLDFKEITSERDEGENFLLTKACIQCRTVILARIYGPNEHDPNFFISMYNKLKSLGEYPIIIGGDFNCTYSTLNIEHNIDCINMNSVPNARHSSYLANFCESLNPNPRGL